MESEEQPLPEYVHSHSSHNVNPHPPQFMASHVNPEENISMFSNGKFFLKNSLPFIVLLIAKISLNHKLGIIIFICFAVSFTQCNTRAVEIMQPNKFQTSPTKLTNFFFFLIILILNIFFIYYTFSEYKLYRCLFLMPPNLPKIDFFSLFWLVIINDFIVKYFTIIIKLIVTMVTKNSIKNFLYQFVEIISRIYRSILPITPWIIFLLSSEGLDLGFERSRSTWSSVFLFISYIIIKLLELYNKIIMFKDNIISFYNFKKNLRRKSSPNLPENCPICHDEFHQPVSINCQHIFCEECITKWLNTNTICPLCRSSILSRTLFTNGETEKMINFF